MKVNNPHSRLTLGLTIRYVLVLAALAVLVTSNFLLLQHQIHLGSADSAIVNASGRQRMLSQRTALLAQRLESSDDRGEIAELYASLRQAHAMLDATHRQLLGDASTATHGASLGEELRALYFDGPDSLDRRYHDYDDLLRRLLNTPLEDRATLRDLSRQISDRGVEGLLLGQLDHAVLLHQQSSEADLRRINRQQRWIWMAAVFTLFYGAFAVFRPMVRRIHDEFTELDQIKRTLELRVSERTREVRRLAQAMEASAEAVIITDHSGIIQYANHAALVQSGYRAEELIGQNANIFRGDPSASAHYADLWATIRSGAVWAGDVVNARKDGSRYHVHLTIAPIRRDDGNIDGYVGIQSDITTSKEAELRLQTANQELDRLATEDALTGIANRRVFDHGLEEEWARARRTGSPLALIMIDIDFFKAYNDSFGHQYGDACLRQVAQALKEVLSRPADRVARYGGEEFAVLLPDTTAAGGMEVAETIRQRIKSLALPTGNTSVSPHVSVSLGVASAVPGRKQAAAELVQAADRALYQAKQTGRDKAMSG